MRTEEELRAALVALEREAPAVARVLPETIIPNGRGVLTWAARRRRFVGLVAAFGAAAGLAVAVAVAVTLLPGAGAARHQHASPTPALLRVRLLDAISAASGTIIYDRVAISGGHAAGKAMETWYYPWRPKEGELVRGRELVLNANGTPLQDSQVSYPEPTPKQEVAASGDIIVVEYATRTWSEQHVSNVTNGDGGSPLNIWYVINDGKWSVVGRTELDGHPAIKLKVNNGSGNTGYLWVDARTYLPLRETFNGVVSKYRTSRGTVTVRAAWRDDYQYLAPTAANLAKLTAPIPPGFRQTR